MKKLIAYIEDEQIEIIRLIAYQKCVTVSAVVRWCVEDFCKANNYTEESLMSTSYNDPEYDELLKK